MHSRSYLFLGLVVFLTALAGFLYRYSTYHLGLDIKGGVRLTYQMDLSKLPKDQLETARATTVTILQNRASRNLGVQEAAVQLKGEDQVIVELPGYQDVEQARKVIGTSAQIIFYDARNFPANNRNWAPYTSRDNQANSDNPEVDFVTKDGTVIKPTITDSPGHTVPNPAYLAVIKDWVVIAAGTDLSKAQMAGQPNGNYWPEMLFTSDGAQKMERWSRANQNSGEQLAAVLDGICISMAPLKEGAILSNEAVIEGNFSTPYVRNLVDLLNSGALPVTLTVLSEAKVDPSIGVNALNQILLAGLIAAGLIAVFMMAYYVFPGIVAVIALALYILFTLTALKWIDATFSLAAIAGFILSVGMAVDANILVFERLKEELRAGRTLEQAIELGFRRALPAIVDSNACTILTALVLVNLGTGPVKGFATTLIIGVAISLFTAVMVTRSLLIFFVGSGIGNHPSWYGLKHQWFGGKLETSANTKPLQVVNKAGRYFLISGLTIVPGIIFALMGGLKGNVEFSGGSEAVYSITGQNVTASQVVANLERAGYKGANATVGSSVDPNTGQPTRQVYVTVPTDKQLLQDPTAARNAIASAAGLSPVPDLGITRVSGTVQKETISNAIWGVVLSSALIILYLSLRFGLALGGFVIGFRFAASTILALIHDILVVIGLAAVMGYLAGWEVSALFISAMLTVIGFSTHDTIVIFDRIRENLRRPLANEDVGNLINRSITQSFARSINTSMTVIATLALLIGIGSATPDLKLFNAAMLVGIISGTYSSIFNASPILYLWDKAIGKKHPDKTLLGIAKANKVNVRITAAPQAAPATPAVAPAAAGAYGQVKRRRASDVERSRRSIDDDL